MASDPAKLGDLLDYDFGRSWRVYLGENAWFRTTNEHHARRLSAELSAAREMREVLRELEWAGAEARYVCPCCERSKDEDHAPDCRLARLIGGGE